MIRKLFAVLAILASTYALAQDTDIRASNIRISKLIYIDSTAARPSAPAGGTAIIWSKGKSGMYIIFPDNSYHRIDSSAVAEDTLGGYYFDLTGIGAGDMILFNGTKWELVAAVPSSGDTNHVGIFNEAGDTLRTYLGKFYRQSDTLVVQYLRLKAGMRFPDGTTQTTSAKSTVYSKDFTILDTVKTGGETVWSWKVPAAITITQVSAYTDANTVTFNLEERAAATPNTTGTTVMTSSLVADNDQQTTTTFTNAGQAADTWLTAVVSAAGDVARFCVTIWYTID